MYPTKTCNHCGEQFTPKFPSAKRCTDCWKKGEHALRHWCDAQDEISRLLRQNQLLQLEIIAMQGNPPDDLSEADVAWLTEQTHNSSHSASARRVENWLKSRRQKRY